jgi:hypothetical protein
MCTKGGWILFFPPKIERHASNVETREGRIFPEFPHSVFGHGGGTTEQRARSNESEILFFPSLA